MLSQAEIDALLAGAVEADQPHGDASINLAALMGQPAVPPQAAAPVADGERAVRPYNFWSPERFSKDQMRAVELVHENLADRLTSSLPPYLRTDFRPRVVHMEQGRADDFLKDLPAGTLFHILLLDPLPGRMMLVINQEITWVILERLLGGSDLKGRKTRALTDIGQALIKGMVEYMLNDIKAAWAKVVTLEPRLEDSTTNHHWVQMMLGNARVLLVNFEITLQNVTGSMGIYIPFSMLKPVANVLNPHVWIAGREERRSDETARQLATDHLQEVPVAVRVILGMADLTIGELVGLKLGDVIPLDTPVRQQLTVRVAERTRFRGQPGTVGNRIAIQISDVVEPINSGEMHA
jgi:flagellar motor switch protein FliM